MTTIRISLHNSVSPIVIGDIVTTTPYTKSEIHMIASGDDGCRLSDLLHLAGDDSTMPDDYEWTGDEVYEVVPN